MGFVQETDVRSMLKDQSLIDEIIQAAVEDAEAMSELAEDVADELEDVLENDPSFRRKIVEAAISNAQFRTQVITKLVEEIGD